MWEWGIRIYDIPGVFNNFPSKWYVIKVILSGLKGHFKLTIIINSNDSNRYNWVRELILHAKRK